MGGGAGGGGGGGGKGGGIRETEGMMGLGERKREGHKVIAKDA